MTFLTPETEKIIINGLLKFQSTPEDPPINRSTLETKNNDLRLNIQENRPYLRKSLDSYKVWDRNGTKVVFLPKDKIVTVDLRYTRTLAAQLWVRIYPVTTSNESQHKSVISCNEHKKQILTKHTNNNASHVLNSILELNDPSAVYETIPLLGGENQITLRVRYFNPETSVHFAFKCYNTCVDVFKRTLPKLMFSIESYNEDKNEYTVLSEESIQFKVCASPTRDYKAEACPVQRKRLCLKPIEAHCNQNVPQYSHNFYKIGDKKYVLKMLTEEECKILESIRNLSQNDLCGGSKEVTEFEERIYRLTETQIDSDLVKAEKIDYESIM